jgi:hypothetical protein
MNARTPIPLRPDPAAVHEQAMTMLVRSVIAIGAGKLNPGVPTREFLARRWGSDAAGEIVQVMRAASAPAMTSQTGWAKELSPVVSAFLAALTPMSAGADLLGRALGLSFDGSGAINLPTVSVGLADFVGEGQNIPVINGVSSIQATLQPFKFSVITALSRETIESASAEQLVGDALLQSTAPSLDRRLFDAGAAVANLRPAGLLFGKTPLTPDSGGGNKDDAMKNDLQALITAVAPVAGNSSIVLVCAPAQSVSVNLRTLGTFAYGVLASSQLAAGTVIAIAVNAIVSASGDAPLIDTTKAASVQMNDSPTGDLMSGGRVTALFQTDCIGLRLRWPLSWTVRDARGIAVMNGVSW